MINDEDQFTINLGSSKNIQNDIFKNKEHPIYLTQPPFCNDHPLIDNFTIISFLSSFDDNIYHFSQTHNSQKYIDGQLFTNFLIISRLSNKIFKIRYQESGNFFVIQILNKDPSIYFKQSSYKLIHNKRKVWIFDNRPILNENSESPIRFKKNKGIEELSDFYNNKSVNRSIQNQVTASLFYSISPFHPKTINRNRYLKINPDGTIEGVFKSFGGYYFKFITNDSVNLPFNVFTWFSPFFKAIVQSEQFRQMTTIELDGTFSALEPYVICVPQIIFRNTGIPLGIMASSTESCSLYSLFFESLKKLDAEMMMISLILIHLEKKST